MIVARHMNCMYVRTSCIVTYADQQLPPGSSDSSVSEHRKWYASDSPTLIQARATSSTFRTPYSGLFSRTTVEAQLVARHTHRSAFVL